MTLYKYLYSKKFDREYRDYQWDHKLYNYKGEEIEEPSTEAEFEAFANTYRVTNVEKRYNSDRTAYAAITIQKGYYKHVEH